MKSTYRSTLAVALAAATLGLAIVPLMAGAQTQARVAMSQSELDAKAYEAFVNGKPELLDSLRAAGADPARHAKTSRDALFDALRPERRIEVLEFVLQSGADPNTLRHENLRRTPIFEARLDPEKIRLLLKYGADPNFKDYSGYTVLSYVLLHPQREITIPPSSVKEGQPARVYGKASLVKLLLDYGVDPNADHGSFLGRWGALGLTGREDKEVIDLVLARGATLTAGRGGVGAGRDHIDLVLVHGGKLLADPETGPVTAAIEIERDDLAFALISRDGKAQPKDRLALLQAARRGWRDLVQTLLRAGADPNVADEQGLTPLAMAERRRDQAMVEMLVAAGAKPSSKTAKPLYRQEGWDAFDSAAAAEIDEVALFDPPRFALSMWMPKDEVSFGLYGKEPGKLEKITCERAADFSIVAHEGEAGRIRVGICSREAKRARELAAGAKSGIDALLGQFGQSGLNLEQEQLTKLGWFYEKSGGPNRSENHYFPIIVSGHGVLCGPTVVVVSGKGDRAVIVQADLMHLCEDGQSIQTPLCGDTKKSLTDIAQRLLTRFGEGH